MKSTRVLIVEDEGLVAADLHLRLQRLGYDPVGIADTAEQAVALAHQLHPQLVLMDIHLAGGSDGTAAATQIQQSLNIPVVFLTAYADASTLERASLCGPFGYVIKPFEECALAATLQMALARHQAEAKVQGMERWLATTLSSIGDAVVSVDAQGTVNFFNP